MTLPARACLLALGVLALGAATAATLGATTRLRASWPPEADALYMPGPTALRLASLGHPELAADLVAARANVYFGGQMVSHGGCKYLARYLETAAALDPRFHGLYLQGAAMIVYTGNAISVEALTAANHLLAEGAAVFPDDWELPFQRGFNLLYELPQVAGEDDPRVPGWREAGAEALRQATLLEGAPPWLTSLAARMLTKEGGEALAIHHLEQVYAVTNDPATRAAIARQLAERRRQNVAGTLEADAERLRQLQAAYPYAPEAFAVLAGPRLTPGLDLAAILRQAAAGHDHDASH